jgi:hypothetical protein
VAIEEVVAGQVFKSRRLPPAARAPTSADPTQGKSTKRNELLLRAASIGSAPPVAIAT